jgi:heat-inducible transcriptional repressor
MAILSSLDDRTRQIFRQIVESYLETGDPVGSRTLSQQGITVSPATIRNVMSDLTDMGLLYSPHVSAGRMPTQAGLRLFVDGIMELGNLTPTERSALEEEAGSPQQANELLSDMAARLSGLTHTAGLVIASKEDAGLKHIEFVRTGQDQAIAVLVSDAGNVENRIIALPPGIPPSALTEASNYLNDRLQGRTLAEARTTILQEIEDNQTALDQLTAELVRQGVAEFDGNGARLIVRGQANLLTAEADADLERVRMLLEDLERKQEVVNLMEAAKSGDGVRIFIGSENRLFSLSGSSVIVAPYRDKAQNIIGAVGVIGPTRLNYAKVIPMVDYTAEIVSRLHHQDS